MPGYSTCAALTSSTIRVCSFVYFRLLYLRVASRYLVFFSFAVVTQDSATLFLDCDRLTDSARKHLSDTIEIKPYTTFFPYLKNLSTTLNLNKDSVSFHQIHFSFPDLLRHDTQQILLGRKTSLAVAEAIGQVCNTPERRPSS